MSKLIKLILALAIALGLATAMNKNVKIQGPDVLCDKRWPNCG